jgi:SprT protein
MNPSHNQRVAVARWAIEALRLLEREDLLEVLRIEWNSRFTRRLGEAQYSYLQKRPDVFNMSGKSEPTAAVRLSVPLWERASEADRHETVVHEVCHLVDCHEAFLANRPNGKPHGVMWQRLMRRCGVEPRTYHNVDRTGLKRRQRRYPATCGCREVLLSGVRVSRMRRGAEYRCTKCGKKIELLSETSEQQRLGL